MPDKLLTTTEAAKILKVPPVTVRYWCKEGRLKGASRFGRDWAIPSKSLEGVEKLKSGRGHKKSAPQSP